MKDVFRVGLREAARSIAEGRFSSADYTRSCLQRIWLMEDQVQAWQWLDHERAMGLAELADRSKNERQAVGLLRGLPLGIKDIFDTRGIPTELGSPLFKGNVPQASAQVVEKLEQAGGFVMGKTVT
ncbi:MAG TPA: amidase family protein, partial [Burkholderiales bacterium]|nr:amidase family protein [Burkholderiales bacterium]